MATKKKTTKKRGGAVRNLTSAERKALSNGYFAFLNKIDALTQKNIDAQTKSDLRAFKASLKKSSGYLHKF